MAIDARDRAFEEIKERTEALIAMAAKDIDRSTSVSNQDVALYSPVNSDGDDILSGKFSYNYSKSSKSGDYSDYYNIYTKITWPEKNRYYFYTTSDYKADETIEFKVHQLAID